MIEETTPAKSNRRTMLIGGVSAVLLGCCALLVVAGLVVIVDPFDLNIIGRLTGRYDAAAAAMPPDAGFYAGVNLLNLNPAEISRLTQPFIEAVGDPNLDSFEGAQDEFYDEVESASGIDIETDVIPWLGQHLGFGITEMDFASFGEFDSVTWILAAEVRDRDAADAFLIKFRDELAASSGNEIAEQTYEDVTLFEMQSQTPDEQIAFGRSGGLFIIGANLAAAQSAIDAQNGSSLDENDDYRRIMGDLPNGRALTVYASGQSLRELLEQNQGAAGVPFNPGGLPLTNFGSAAVAFSIVDPGLQIDIVSLFDQDELTANQQAMFAAAAQPVETAGLFPDQTVAFLSGSRLDLLWLSIRESTGDETAFDESMDAFAQEFGVNPGTELFPLLNGQWALGIVAGQSGFLAEELEIPLGLAFIAGTDRPAELTATLDAIRAALEGQLLIVESGESDGLTGYQVSLGEDLPPAFSFGLEQDYFFIATSQETAAAVFAGGPALAESEQYQAVESEFAGDINLSFYLDVRALLGTLREGRTGFELQDFNEAIQGLEPLRAVALGNAYDDDIRRTQIIIFIETE
jgi:hypothetical protein